MYHYHDGVSTDDLSKHTFIGETAFTLASLLTNREKKLTPNLVGGRAQ